MNHSERIGKLEQAIEILVEREARTGKDLESLHSHNRDLRRKVSDLEQADSFLREANRDLTSRVERLESEQNKFGNLLVKFEVDLGATHGIRELIEELRRDHQSAWSRAETFFSALKNLEHRLDNFHDGRTNELFEQFRSLQTLVGGFEMRICQTERDGKTLVDLLNALDGKVNLFESDKHGLEIMIRKDFESRFGDFQKTIDIKILDLGGKYDHYDQHLHGLGNDIADFKRAINELREEFGSSKYNLNEIRSQFHSLSQKIELLRSFEQFMDEMKGSHDTMNTRIVSLTMEIKNLDSKHGSVHNSLRQGLAELKDRMKSDLKELDISLKLHLERDVKSLGQKIRDLEEKEFMILKAMLLDKLRDSDSERKVILAKFDGLEKDFLIWKKEPVRNIHDSVITSICNDIQSRVEKIIQVGDVDVKKWVKCLEKELRALEKEFGKLPDYSKDITVLKEIKRENDGIRGEQKNMNMRINTNGHDIRSQNKRIDQLEKQDEMLKKRVDSVEARTSRDHDKIESLENGMEHHQKKVEVKITKNEVRIHKQGKEIDDKLDNLRRGIFDQVMKILEEMKVGIMIEVKDISFDDTLFNAFKGDIEKQLCGQSGEISSLKRLVRDNIEKLIVVKELITQVKSNKESIEDLKRLKPRLERLTKDLESLRDNTNIRMQKLESGFRKESDKQGDLNAKVREDLRALERALNKFISDINQDIHMIENKSKELVHVEVNQWNAQITRNFEESNRDLEERLARRIVEIHDFFTKNEVEIGRLRDWNQSRCEDLKRMIEDRFGGQGQFNEAIEKELNVSIEKIRVDIEASIKRIEQQIGNNEEIDGVKVSEEKIPKGYFFSTFVTFLLFSLFRMPGRLSARAWASWTTISGSTSEKSKTGSPSSTRTNLPATLRETAWSDR